MGFAEAVHGLSCDARSSILEVAALLITSHHAHSRLLRERHLDLLQSADALLITSRQAHIRLLGDVHQASFLSGRLAIHVHRAGAGVECCASCIQKSAPCASLRVTPHSRRKPRILSVTIVYIRWIRRG